MDNEYKELEKPYIDFLFEMKRTIEKLFDTNEIKIAFSIEGRIKALESIKEKKLSGRFKIKKSITELNDLVGLRIVLLFPDSKGKVIQLLKKTFREFDSFTKKEKELDKFGYSSVHLILGIKKEWESAPQWSGHYDKKIEIQIRTLSEHIWAETSHNLFYKKEENIPDIIHRDLYKLSAILEFIDDRLQDIKDRVTAHFKYINETDFNTILTMDLNAETFRRVLLENSKGMYDYNDYANMELSSRIEKDYNIQNTDYLHNLIYGKINLDEFTNEKFVNQILLILEEEKSKSASSDIFEVE